MINICNDLERYHYKLHPMSEKKYHPYREDEAFKTIKLFWNLQGDSIILNHNVKHNSSDSLQSKPLKIAQLHEMQINAFMIVDECFAQRKHLRTQGYPGELYNKIT